jgi:hypothetical protein
MHDPVTTTPTTSATADAQDRTDPRATTTPGDTPFLLRLLGIVLPMAVLLLMAAAVVAAAYYFWSQRNRPIVLPGDQVDFDTVDAPARAAAALVDGADVQRSQLESGEPRNAIVACWDHFEDAAGRVGLGRRRWETSSEFTVRLLRDLDADTGAVGRLAALYREARFSEHPLGEEARSRALAALEDIHASLRQTVRGR